ncbi:hypothetical protein CgunFtcFv8_015132 [Champsocephalus gunnari]|uniref:Uncharacterized protein n=1 Tax=Champsocephalus gunnari TaxID=52237 RepID=A0AAN8E3Z9_CHAGU|nr:hypothetical protein CgunFtcFv8_015132 [Champsocephalus gunnari]
MGLARMLTFPLPARGGAACPTLPYGCAAAKIGFILILEKRCAEALRRGASGTRRGRNTAQTLLVRLGG